MNQKNIEMSPLGKPSSYITSYTPSLLFPIPRKTKRDEIQVPEQLPFEGVDLWNAYEISWLNPKGKPQVAIAEFVIPCTSPNIIESKSFKLYLNSFNQSPFASSQEVMIILEKDISKGVGEKIQVNLITPQDFHLAKIQEFEGTCLDDLDIEVSSYRVHADYLKSGEDTVDETLYSNLLKSNCLVTGQPDWASLQIHYIGPKIHHESLLKYLISFREHNEFHEQCVERIFMDLSHCCRPDKLTVYGRYTRRGGLDINPFRSNFESTPTNFRHCRQ
ncbi:MAG: 7-cyano-7-deazaguanine reductase [Chlamydiales bacterium]|jgi:7-cyano-7-deazaguanine reductase